MSLKFRRISEFEASLVYRVSFGTARATQRNPVLKKTKQKQKQKKKEKSYKELTVAKYFLTLLEKKKE